MFLDKPNIEDITTGYLWRLFGTSPSAEAGSTASELSHDQGDARLTAGTGRQNEIVAVRRGIECASPMKGEDPAPYS